MAVLGVDEQEMSADRSNATDAERIVVLISESA
jgi:hypothetical protein